MLMRDPHLPGMIPRHLLEDTAISWKAKGVAVYIIDKAEQGATGDMITAVGKESRDAVYSALKELEASGLIQRVVKRVGGKIASGGYIWVGSWE
jgi:predicted transcriptional regulator